MLNEHGSDPCDGRSPGHCGAVCSLTSQDPPAVKIQFSCSCSTPLAMTFSSIGRRTQADEARCIAHPSKPVPAGQTGPTQLRAACSNKNPKKESTVSSRRK